MCLKSVGYCSAKNEWRKGALFLFLFRLFPHIKWLEPALDQTVHVQVLARIIILISMSCLVQ